MLYQSEARTRGEHMNRVRRRLQMEKEEADKKGHEHPFDPARPWNEAFRQLCVGEGTWWFEQFREPCMYVHDGDHHDPTRRPKCSKWLAVVVVTSHEDAEFIIKVARICVMDFSGEPV